MLNRNIRKPRMPKQTRFTLSGLTGPSDARRRITEAGAAGLVAGAIAMSAALPATAVEYDIAASEVTASPPAPASTLLLVPTQTHTLSAHFRDSSGLWSSGRHTGLDFVADTGTPVFAAHDGVVVSAQDEGAYGNSVVLQRADGLQTRYGHLSRMSVKPGETVTAGQKIGRVGDTGNTTGPHLHFEVIVAGKQRNPEIFIWGAKHPSDHI